MKGPLLYVFIFVATPLILAAFYIIRGLIRNAIQDKNDLIAIVQSALFNGATTILHVDVQIQADGQTHSRWLEIRHPDAPDSEMMPLTRYQYWWVEDYINRYHKEAQLSRLRRAARS